MKAGNRSTAKRSTDSGVSILIIAVSMVFILAMAGLGIDLASLYVGRNQAQRAADAAALAGAQAFVDAGCATGSTGGGLTQTCMTLATQRAEAVGNANLIAGTSPGITDADISFPNTTSSDPQIQVVAGRGTYDGTDHSNPMPTFFMKIFGVTTASVSATARAEAYNPSGSSTTAGSQCVKPWLFPNCDEFNAAGGSNPNCPNGSGGYYGPFVNTDGTVARPTNYPSGAIGEPYVIKPADPKQAAAPGQFYAVYLPTISSIPTSCPSCATVVNQGGSGSGALYRANIECCNNSTISCDTQVLLNTTLQSTAGAMQGPSQQGVDCLIHQSSGNGNGKGSCGQDFAAGSTNNCTDPSSALATDMPLLPSIPPTIMPGANNPYDPGGTSPITASNSDSVVLAPIYNGILTSGQNYVTVAGFVQLFIRDVTENGKDMGTTYAYVLGVSGCGTGGTGPSPGGGGSGGSGSGGSVVSSTGSYAPVRLIHQ